MIGPACAPQLEYHACYPKCKLRGQRKPRRIQPQQPENRRNGTLSFLVWNRQLRLLDDVMESRVRCLSRRGDLLLPLAVFRCFLHCYFTGPLPSIEDFCGFSSGSGCSSVEKQR
jgi:hypothetical protein